MHTSPCLGRTPTVTCLTPSRSRFTFRYSAKVRTLAVCCFCLTSLWISPVSRAAEPNAFQDALKGHGFSRAEQLLYCCHPSGVLQLAENVASDNVLKGHGFSRAGQLLYCCHPSGALGPEGSALPALLAAIQDKTPDAPPADQPATPATQAIDFSDEVVRDVLTDLQRGIEAHNIDLVLEVFDQQNMKDYAQFHDQMVAFFRRYDSVKFRYQLLQVTSNNESGFAIADIDMDADPSDILPTPQRRSTQMRFQMKRGPKGWKVVALRPSDFFNQ